MPIFRQWRLVLSLFAAAALAAPAFAQQPPSADQSAAPPAAATPAPSPAPKPKKHKAASPATNGPSDTATPASSPPAPPATAPAGVKPTLLGQYGDWGAYTASPGGKKVCFAIAKSSVSETDPPGKSRNPPYLFVSSRPGEKVSNEVSVAIGYPFKPASEATVEIGSNSFALYTQQDGAWIKNAGEEAHLVDVMRSAQNAVVKGMSAKGTHSTDTFSLRGFGQALDRTEQGCK
jgi:Invasion associated locus B (IalB) protein